MYSKKLSPEMENMINNIYEEIHSDAFTYSFYLEFFQKQATALWKSISNGLDSSTKEVIQYAVKGFVQKKAREGELIPLYNIRCFSCKKKIYGPVNSLDDLPEELTCQHCGSTLYTEEDYLDYDLRFAFSDKTPPKILV